MHCLGYCLIGAILIGSMIVVMVGRNSAADKAFKASLSEQQTVVYQQIYKERLSVYLQGLALGALIAVCYAFLFADKKAIGANACVITATVLGVAYLYYMVRPKMMMLDHLESKEQVGLYTDLYQQYQFRSGLGMVLGAVGLFLVAVGTNKM